MTIKNIYVRSSDAVNIHVITDDDYDATKAGWDAFVASRSPTCPPRPILLLVRGREEIEVSNPMVNVYGGRQQGKFNNRE